jgi:hypothetical protein
MNDPARYAEYRPATLTDAEVTALFAQCYGAPPQRILRIGVVLLAGPKPELAEAGLSCVQETQAVDAIGAPQVTHTTRNGKGRVGRIKKGER